MGRRILSQALQDGTIRESYLHKRARTVRYRDPFSGRFVSKDFVNFVRKQSKPRKNYVESAFRRMQRNAGIRPPPL